MNFPNEFINGLDGLSLDDQDVFTTTNPQRVAIRLKFTKKEFLDLQKTISALEYIFQDENITEYAMSKLSSSQEDFTKIYKSKNFLHPLKDIQSKIVVPKNSRGVSSDKTASSTYFTRPTSIRPKAIELFNKIQDNKNLHLKYDQISETCVSDIRNILNAYFSEYHLKEDMGIFFDDFLTELFDSIMLEIPKIDNRYYIPKGDRKLIFILIKSLT